MLGKTLASGKRMYWEFKELWKFARPNLLEPCVRASERSNRWLAELSQKGVVRIEDPAFEKIADYLDETYFKKLERTKGASLQQSDLAPGMFANDINQDKYKEYGNEILVEISLRDPNIAPIFFHEDIAAMLYNYYNRQPYYRNQPVLEKVSFSASLDAKKGNTFHVDHLRQISFMLLVTTQTENDTHMLYAVGTHRRPMLTSGIYLNHAQAEEVGNRSECLRLTGKKGTLFIFDTSGVHKRNLLAGNPRKILHCNVTTGHHMGRFLDETSNWPAYEAASEHLRKMFHFLVKPGTFH